MIGLLDFAGSWRVARRIVDRFAVARDEEDRFAVARDVEDRFAVAGDRGVRVPGVGDRDRPPVVSALFDGVAVIAPEGDGMRYCESGTLRIDGQMPMQAAREYLWQADGAGIVVRFADGRDFHRFEPGSDLRAEHPCGEDLYLVRYDFGAGAGRDDAAKLAEWTTEWIVRGPRKDYTMTSVYSAVGGIGATPPLQRAALSGNE